MGSDVRRLLAAATRSTPAGLLAAASATAAATALMAPWQDRIGLLNEGLVLLLVTLLISAGWGLRAGLFAAVATNLALNFFFVEPLHAFNVQEPENAIALAVFLIVSVVGGSLVTSARAATAEAQRRAAETQVLLRMSRALTGQSNANEALLALCEEVIAALDAPGAAVLSRRDGGWQALASAGAATSGRAVDASERALADGAVAARKVQRTGHTGLGGSRRVRIIAPAGTQRFAQPSSGMIFAPLLMGSRVLGVLRVDGPIGATPFSSHPEHLIEAFAAEAALAVQRVELVQAAAHADALRQADEMKTALLTSISHDLKTPLAGIKASVSSLLDATVDWPEHDRSAFLETIDSQTDRLNRVISDILDLNRLESGAIAPALTAIDVRDVLNDVRAATSLTTAGRQVTVTAERALVVRADETLLHQALVNLTENAARYSRADGAIRLNAWGDGERTMIAVEDDGPGISRDDLPHVFDRFYRAPEHSRRVRGSGLGLAIVKGFVELSGGTVRVESSEDGTRFLVTLPAAAGVAVGT